MRHAVCVDLDGVLGDYSHGWQGVEAIGDPIPGAREFLLALSGFARVVIYTTRCKSDVLGRDVDPRELQQIVKGWLDRHDLFHDEIYTGQGKPIASAYVDDRAVACTPQKNPDAFQLALILARSLCQKEL